MPRAPGDDTTTPDRTGPVRSGTPPIGFRPEPLGPGAVYFAPLDAAFRQHPDLLAVAEIEPQTQWIKATTSDAKPRGSALRLHELASLPQRKLLHGVGYPLGGTVCDQTAHTGELRRWAERLGSPWTSEHLSVLEIPASPRPLPCGFLMPPLQTNAAVSLIVANTRARMAALGHPFAFETGVNYFAPRAGEMDDGSFFAAIAGEAGCGIVLDLNNLWVNQRNGRDSIERIMHHLPLDRVWEIHLAGADWVDGRWLDAHCGAIDPDLVAITAEIVPHLPNLGAIIFELAPDRVDSFGIPGFLGQIETLHRLWAVRRADPLVNDANAPRQTTVPRAGDSTARRPQPPMHPSAGVPWTPAAWEALIAQRMLPPANRPGVAMPTPRVREADDATFALYGRLVASFRFGALADMLPNTLRLLVSALGEDELRTVLGGYIADNPPALFPSDEALAFVEHLQRRRLPVPGLADILRFEAAPILAFADGRTVQITLSRAIGPLLDDIAACRLPAAVPDVGPMTLEIGGDPEPFVRLTEGGAA